LSVLWDKKGDMIIRKRQNNGNVPLRHKILIFLKNWRRSHFRLDKRDF